MTDNVFSSASQENEQTTNVFEEKPSAGGDDKNYLAELVGEGRKFKTVDDLARGKAESDRFISKLQQELDELRKEVEKQDYASELLAKLQEKNKATDTSTVINTGKENEKPNSSNLSESDVKALVTNLLTEQEKKNTASQNITKASQELSKRWGEKAGEVLKTKAQEIGMSVERLQEMAAESPTAFLKLVDATESAPSNPNLPKSKVNTEQFSSSGTERDWTYYQNLRRESKRKYFSAEVQRQMFKDMERLGDRFGLPKN